MSILVKRVKEMLTKAGFKGFIFVQTLFGELDEIETAQDTKPGYGEGSLVVVKAVKK